MSDDDLKNELERLGDENAALKNGAATGITMKVREKGGLSIYGMGRFPVTLGALKNQPQHLGEDKVLEWKKQKSCISS